MAATNYTPIQLYYSTTASTAPSSGNLANGELAINITDGKLYYKDNGGVVQVIATKGSGSIGGSTTQIQYNNAGALAGNAAMTFNSGTNVTTLTTLNLTNALGATYGGTAQSAYTQGDILYSSATNTLSKLGIGTVNYILTSSGSVPQWVAPTSIVVQTANNLAGGLAGSVPYQSALDTTTFLAIGAANRVMSSTGSAPQWVTSLTGLTGVSSSSITNTSLTSGRVVISSTAGLESDSANLTFNGTTLSTTGLSNTGFSTLVKTLTLGDSSFNGTAVFAAATPAKLYLGTGTVTDVTSAISATNGVGAIASLAITPIAATNTGVTYTNASTLYIAGAPSAGTNITITNPYSLYIAAGASYFGGAVDFAVTPSYSGGTANGVMYLNGSKQITTGSVLTFDGTTLSSTKFAGALNGTVGATTANTGAFTTVTATGTLSGGTSGSGYSFDGSAPAGSLSLISGGRFGIGMSLPTSKLTIGNDSFTAAASNTTGMYTGANGLIVLSDGLFIATRAGVDRVVLDTSGNLGLGVTPSAWVDYKAMQFGGGAIASYTGNAFFECIQNAFWDGAFKYVNNGFASSYQQTSGQHRWNTAASGTAGNAISFTQAMTLDGSGNLLLGTTSVIGAAKQTIGYNGNLNNGLTLNETQNVSNTAFIYFYDGNASAVIGSVTRVGTTAAVIFNTTSDYRLKTVVGAVAGQGARIDALQPIEYTWNSNGSSTRGFLAHQFQEVYPSSVTGTKDAVDADGKPVYQAMQASTSEVIADLVAELQSLRARVAQLESKP